MDLKGIDVHWANGTRTFYQKAPQSELYLTLCLTWESLEGLSHLSSPSVFFPPVFNRGPQSCPPCLAAEAHLDPQSLDSWPQGLLSMWSPLLLIWHRSCPFAFGPLFFPSCWDHVNAVLPFLIASVGSYLGSRFSWLVHVSVWQKPLQYCN